MSLTEEIEARGQKAVDYLIQFCHKNIFPEDPLRKASLHYLNSGGKGFRPAMLQLVCGALNGDEAMAIAPSAAIESLHVSSLLHDDYMDQDDLRRGVEAVWKKWNPTVAILAGDVLFGVAFSIVGDVENITPELKYGFTKELGQIYTKLCEGQMLDISFENVPFIELDEAQITHMQYLKTGVLFEFACVTGARIALNKMEDEVIDVIREYAKLAGTAFQIQDDLIGIVGESNKIGKPVGSDIKAGKRTLIAIHGIKNANDHQKEILLQTLGDKNVTEAEISNCVNVLSDIGSIKYAQKLAKQMATKAVDLTKQLPQNKQTELLKEFANYMIERMF
ncbi:MAG: Short chain isoprenyl diphosphate synthase [Candidatus Heimdallarchaeota archaeon LC_2]|nr:MAG: Short chain isoprenyl diphosphate synthase [Candidatus Heimdallarchaeota archaeon LC_2]